MQILLSVSKFFFFTLSYAGAVFVQFCTEMQGDICMGIYVPYEVYNPPVSAHTLKKGQLQNQELLSLLFANSVWVL